MADTEKAYRHSLTRMSTEGVDSRYFKQGVLLPVGVLIDSQAHFELFQTPPPSCVKGYPIGDAGNFFLASGAYRSIQ